MTSEERMQILKMIETGAISAEEGMKLLETLEKSDGPGQGQPADRLPAQFKVITKKGKSLHVHVYEGDAVEPKVDVSVPLGLANAIKNLIPQSAKAAMEVDGQPIDLDNIFDKIREGTNGTLLEVNDSVKKERVRIFID